MMYSLALHVHLEQEQVMTTKRRLALLPLALAGYSLFAILLIAIPTPLTFAAIILGVAVQGVIVLVSDLTFSSDTSLHIALGIVYLLFGGYMSYLDLWRGVPFGGLGGITLRG